MDDILEKYFSHYVISARFKPILFIFMPAILTIMAWYPGAKNLSVAVFSFLVTFGVFSFLSNAISIRGNKIQDELFLKCGGAPTTLLLRHKNDIIDSFTKQRYHAWLGKKLPNLLLPNQNEENDNPIEADHKYISAINFLREYTRDSKRYSMIYNDNVSYGFSRNLYAIKNYALMISLLCLPINIFLFVLLIGSSGEFFNGTSVLFCIFSMLFSIVFVIFLTIYVTENYVYDRGVRYAKSLLAVCDIE